MLLGFFLCLSCIHNARVETPRACSVAFHNQSLFKTGDLETYRDCWVPSCLAVQNTVVIRGEITFGWIDTKIFEDLNLR